MAQGVQIFAEAYLKLFDDHIIPGQEQLIILQQKELVRLKSKRGTGLRSQAETKKQIREVSRRTFGMKRNKARHHVMRIILKQILTNPSIFEQRCLVLAFALRMRRTKKIFPFPSRRIP